MLAAEVIVSRLDCTVLDVLIKLAKFNDSVVTNFGNISFHRLKNDYLLQSESDKSGALCVLARWALKSLCFSKRRGLGWRKGGGKGLNIVVVAYMTVRGFFLDRIYLGIPE